MTQFYAYLHLDPSRGMAPFYAGKGQKRRAWDMRNRNRMHKFRVAHIRSLGLEPEVKIVIDNIDEELAFLVEAEMIDKYGRRDLGKGTLLNFSDGGEGPIGFKHTEEFKKAASLRMKGKVWTEDQLARRAETQRHVIFPEASQATRDKISATNKGKKKPAGFGRAVGDKLKGYKHTGQALANMRASRKTMHFAMLTCISCHKEMKNVGDTLAKHFRKCYER